jgi:hypothetical protein
VAHPQIAVFARLAKGGDAPLRRIEGQKTLLGRTMHAIHYNEVRDEIVVPQQFAQAILTFRGVADGEEPPIRILQGSRTQLQGDSRLVLDVINNEIITERKVFPLDANGNVAPIRTTPYNVMAVDPVNDLYVGSLQGEQAGLVIFSRKATDRTPLRTITGPKTMMIDSGGRTRVHNGWIIMGHDGVQDENPSGLSFVGVWSIFDSGDVPPRWTIGGPNRMLVKPRGVDIDVKNQTVIVSDKDLNAVLTYHVPEVFREPARSQNTEELRGRVVAAERNPRRNRKGTIESTRHKL